MNECIIKQLNDHMNWWIQQQMIEGNDCLRLGDRRQIMKFELILIIYWVKLLSKNWREGRKGRKTFCVLRWLSNERGFLTIWLTAEFIKILSHHNWTLKIIEVGCKKKNEKTSRLKRISFEQVKLDRYVISSNSLKGKWPVKRKNSSGF